MNNNPWNRTTLRRGGSRRASSYLLYLWQWCWCRGSSRHVWTHTSTPRCPRVWQWAGHNLRRKASPSLSHMGSSLLWIRHWIWEDLRWGHPVSWVKFWILIHTCSRRPSQQLSGGLALMPHWWSPGQLSPLQQSQSHCQELTFPFYVSTLSN